MATLVPGRVFRSREPLLTVDNALDPGAWRFRLTVIDDERNESEPAELVVRVEERGHPRDPFGRFVPVRPVRPIG